MRVDSNSIGPPNSPAGKKASTYASTLRFLFCSKARLTGRADSNSIGPPNSPEGKKAPAGLF